MRETPDADPARVYHNIVVAIDASRQLFNGQPATLAPWLDALAPGGRMMVPMTASMPAMGPIGKGFVFLVERQETFRVKAAGFVAIYSAIGIRDELLNAQLGKAMMTGPQRAQAVTRLRR